MNKLLRVTGFVVIFMFPTYGVSSDMKMDKNYGQMNMMMNKAEKTKDKSKRHDYMHKHMKLMMDHMDAMDSMMEPSKLGKDAKTMEERMNNMQKMMKQMVRQQKMMMEFMEYND